MENAVLGLRGIGLRPGDRVACLTPRLLCERIVIAGGFDDRASIPDETEEFFRTPSPERDRVLARLPELGIKGALQVFRDGPPAPGWQPVGSLSLYYYPVQ